MRKRIITATILLTILIPVVIIEQLFPAFIVAMVILTGVGAYEMLKMFNKKEEMPKLLFVLSIILTLVFYFSVIMSTKLPVQKFLENYIKDIDLNLSVFLIGFLLYTTIVFLPKRNISLLSSSFMTIFYVGLSFSSITLLRMMGVRFIIYLFLITIMTDMFAYFIGIKFGKRRLAPQTSPKKSVEGAVAGSIAGTIIASLFALFFDIYPNTINPDGLQTIFTSFSKMGDLSRGMQALIVVPVTFLATVVSQVGDLVASKFKRNYDIKDFGNIFPGHGGVVDRFDSSMLLSMFLVLFLSMTLVLFPL